MKQNCTKGAVIILRINSLSLDLGYIFLYERSDSLRVYGTAWVCYLRKKKKTQTHDQVMHSTSINLCYLTNESGFPLFESCFCIISEVLRINHFYTSMIQVRWCTCKDGWQKHASMIEFNHIFVLFDQNGDLARHIIYYHTMYLRTVLNIIFCRLAK